MPTYRLHTPLLGKFDVGINLVDIFEEIVRLTFTNDDECVVDVSKPQSTWSTRVFHYVLVALK